MIEPSLMWLHGFSCSLFRSCLWRQSSVALPGCLGCMATRCLQEEVQSWLSSATQQKQVGCWGSSGHVRVCSQGLGCQDDCLLHPTVALPQGYCKAQWGTSSQGCWEWPGVLVGAVSCSAPADPQAVSQLPINRQAGCRTGTQAVDQGCR